MPELMDLLRCPYDQGRLSQQRDSGGGCVLRCVSCSDEYPIVNNIPRFVGSDGYSRNFGFQWNKFRKTQLDSHTGTNLSRDRFYQQCQWKPEELRGKAVLDIGCGAGRFTEIALQAGANVFAIDYSNAVEACYENHSNKETLTVAQADIYQLPFSPGSFDYVYCFGVLQHTPDVQRAFQQLHEFVKPGGKVCVDLYLKKWNRRFHPKRLLRPLTTRMDHAALFKLLQRVVPCLLWINQNLRKFPFVGRQLTRFVPVADYSNLYDLNQQQLQEWALLDTFDWLAPAYDSPQTPEELKKWMQNASLKKIEVEVPGFIVGRAIKK